MSVLPQQRRAESVVDRARRLDEEEGYTNTNVAPSRRQ